MDIRKIIGAAAVASLLVANVASAQVTATNSAVTVAGLQVGLITAQQVAAGTMNAPIAAILLNAGQSSDNVTLSSLPLEIGVASGGTASAYLSNCTLHEVTGAGATGGSSGSTGGSQQSVGPSLGTPSMGGTGGLTAPVTVEAGTTAVIGLFCDVSAQAPVGSQLQLQVVPAEIPAVSAVSGAGFAPTGFLVSGTSVPTSGTVTIVAPGSTSSGQSSSPGVPNTGAGGNASGNLLVLSVTALAALMGSAFLVRRYV